MKKITFIISLCSVIACNNSQNHSQTADNNQRSKTIERMYSRKPVQNEIFKTMNNAVYSGQGQNAANGFAANVQFGVAKPTGVPCAPGAGLCNIKGVAPASLGTGLIPSNPVMFSSDGNYLYMNIHLDSLKNSTNPNNVAMYSALVNFMANGVNTWPSGFSLPATICSAIGITPNMSGLFNQQTGLYVPTNTYFNIYYPSVDTTVDPIDSEYIQIQFWGLFNATATGNTVDMLLGANACDNNSPGICSFSLLAAGGNNVQVFYGANTVYIWINYNNLVATQPNMAQYFKLDSSSVFVTGAKPNFQQTDTFVFTTTDSALFSTSRGIAAGISVPPQSPIVIASANSNWFGIQYRYCFLQTNNQVAAFQKRRAKANQKKK